MATKGDTIGSDVVARHMSRKIHTWRGKYDRLWALTPTAVQNVDPSNFSITNSWPWTDVVDFAPAVSSLTDFTLTVKNGKKSEVLKYSADVRSPLLCDLQRYFSGETGSRRFIAVKITRSATRQEILLELGTWYINVLSQDGKKLTAYPFKEISAMKQLRDDPSAFVLYVHGRPRLYATPERSEFLRLMSGYLTKLGLTHVISDTPIVTADYRTDRLSHGNDGAPKVGEYEVLKRTPRYPTPRTRKIVITESCITERDTATYAVVSARPLQSISALIRHWDEPQRLTVEYRDGSSRSYYTSLRDSLLGSALDACRNTGHAHVAVHAELTRPGDRLLPLSIDDDADIQQLYLEHLKRNVKMPQAGPYNTHLVRAAAEFNVNVTPLGVPYATKKGMISGVLPDLVNQLTTVLAIDDMPTAVIITLLNAVARLVSCAAGAKMFLILPEAQSVILGAIRHEDDGVVYAGFELLRRMVDNPRRPSDQNEDSEAEAKRILLTVDARAAVIQALDVHSGSGGGAVLAGNEGTLVMMSVTNLLDSVLVSHVDTTPQDVNDHLMQLTASRYAALLALFRCQCSGVVESSAMLMRAIVDQADVGTCRAMQAAALSSGVWLRHFYNALFAQSMDQRYVSRYLVELWSTGNATAREVLRHTLPAGLLLYLDMPKLSGSEAAHLEAVEAGLEPKDPKPGTVSLRDPNDKTGLAQRLRSRLEAAERASHNRVKRRLAALDENAAGAKKGTRKKDREIANANMAAAAAAAVAAQAAMTKAKIEEGKEENFPVFFFQMLQEHMLPDLIWNQQTRGELKAALEAELREIEREIELGGQSTASASATISNKSAAAAAAAPGAAVPGPSGAAAAPSLAAQAIGSINQAATITGGVDMVLQVAWNFSEFEVEYPSLVQELRVGDYYLRLFLEAGEASVATLRDAPRFFDALYRRVLRENAPNLKCMCLRGMTRVYERHHKLIGPFDDTDYMVYLLSQATHAEVRDRLLLLLLGLSVNPINCEKMINPDCLELLVDLLTTAHTTDTEQRGVPVLKGGASLLLLRDATPAEAAQGGASGAAPESAPNSNPKESMKVWHYRALKADLQPGEKPEKGPYSLQDMQRLGDMKKLTNGTLVWAQGMREWVRLDSMRALMWYTLSEGLPALTPTQRGEVCCELLKRLVQLRPSVDAEGAPVRPVPRAKRVLCGPRTLPHITQSLLAGSPKLVDLVAQLIVLLVEYNPKSMIKLYMTGLFYFILGYNGSNWASLSQLIHITHLKQSFHSDAASLTSESTLAKRSILGPMVPESLICVLENRGSTAFADTLLSNVDNPEVIWKYSMRAHLLDMVTQHLGDLPARLSANPCTLYDYCPIPPIRYEELDNELWCSNYYLGNLCDEIRFPDWQILDPVGLLRAVLDAWRLEVTKTGETHVSSDEAYALLGLAKDADDKEIRKAYRKLAIKFHPDKNPQGRETFEKIQKAYDLLTMARGPDINKGPDQVSILLMVKTQCILFSRHAKVLKQYKYAGYPLLMEYLQVAPDQPISGDRAIALEAATRLVYLTCLASPKNAEELVRENGMEVLLYLMSRLVPLACVNPPLPAEDVIMKILGNVLHTISGMATLKEARDRAAAVTAFPAHLCACLMLAGVARVMQHALDAVSRLAVAASLQDALINAGAIYRMMPLLFRYDATLEALESAATGQAPPPNANNPKAATAENNEQKAANMQAKLAVRALGRLGGYLDGDLATPVNPRVRRSLAALLTPPLAKRLARQNPDGLLKTLNSHEESAFVVWTAPMRKELMQFVAQQLDTVNRTGVADMVPANGFIYAALRDELRIAGIYMRFYINDSSLTLDDPYASTLALLQHIAYSKVGGAVPKPPTIVSKDDMGEEGPEYNYEGVPLDLGKRHLRLALRALHLVIVNYPGTENVVAKDGHQFVPALFSLLERDESADGDAGSELVHAAGASTNKGAAGSGASAGAGGARSTPAPPSAGLRELVLTAIAAFAPYEPCATTVARLYLIPTLIRLLHRDSAAFGPILRTFFAHSTVIQEMGRIGVIIDLMVFFAGGIATGPAPGRPGGPKLGSAPQLSVPKSARAAAGALLSVMCSDTIHGPPLLMALTQLVPEALAIAIKESVSGATSAGTGASSVMTTGSGIGAAGAGGGTGAGGDVVLVFDQDHETPELIWNAVCRHELRCALGELINGLTGLRKRAATVGAAGGADGCGWSMPATFRVRYSAHEGELRVGGVYIRLFLKEPTFPLRDPKAFLEALLRRFLQEAEILLGITSEDAEKVREAQAQAAVAAKAEEAAGGVAAKTRANATAENQMVLRGEDVLTQVTHAIVCLLRVRTVLADHAASLGYLAKLVQLLSSSSGKAARYNLGLQCVRVLQVLAVSKACIAAASKVNVIPVLFRSMTPLHRDSAFTLDCMKILLETDTSDNHVLVEAALKADAIPFLVNILEKAKLDHLVDPSAAKVHSVAILKILENDAIHGPMAQAMLQQHRESWEKYRHQKHDLFLSRNDTRDYFLTDVATAPSMMLKNAAEWTGAGGPTEAPTVGPLYGSAAPAASANITAPANVIPLSLLSPEPNTPPPAPEFIPQQEFKIGGFQAPAPAPLAQTSAPAAAPAPAVSLLGAGFATQATATAAMPILGGGFAAAKPAVAAAPPVAQTAVAAADPFAVFNTAPPPPRKQSLLGAGFGAPLPAAAPAAGNVDPFTAMFTTAPAAPAAPAPAPKPAAGYDPFADLLG